MNRIVYNTCDETHKVTTRDTAGYTTIVTHSGGYIDTASYPAVAKALWDWLKTKDLDDMQAHIDATVTVASEYKEMCLQLDEMRREVQTTALVNKHLNKAPQAVRVPVMLTNEGWQPHADEYNNQPCNHQPREVTLLYSVVTECSVCGERLDK